MFNPARLMEEISLKTPDGFLKEVFKDRSYKLLTEDLKREEINESIYDGLRLVQNLCYHLDPIYDKIVPKQPDWWEQQEELPEPEPKRKRQLVEDELRELAMMIAKPVVVPDGHNVRMNMGNNIGPDFIIDEVGF
jgi:hypothetical protein